MYNFNKILDRKNTDCVKWDMVDAGLGKNEVLPFWIADMDFEVLPELTQAIIKRAEHPTYGYTFPSENYFETFKNWAKTRHDFEVKKEEIIPVPGIVCATAFIIHALTEKGDKVMVNTPVYNPFFSVIKEHERVMVNSELKIVDGVYKYDFEDMEQKFKDGVKLFILCSPHNPTGRIWEKSELEDILALCKKYNVYIFSDEIHWDLAIKPDVKHIPMLNIKGSEELTIMSVAPSKTFNIAGLKSSMIIIRNEEIHEKIKNAVSSFHISPSLFAFKATEVAYQHGAQWVDELQAYLYNNAKEVVSFFENNLPKVKTYIPDGTYLMWLDFSAYGLSQEVIMDKLLKESLVHLNSGPDYGPNGEADGYVRLNIAIQHQLLVEGLNRIKSVFETL